MKVTNRPIVRPMFTCDHETWDRYRKTQLHSKDIRKTRMMVSGHFLPLPLGTLDTIPWQGTKWLWTLHTLARYEVTLDAVYLGDFVPSYKTLCTFLQDTLYLRTRHFIPSYKTLCTFFLQDYFVPSHKARHTFSQDTSYLLSSYKTLRPCDWIRISASFFGSMVRLHVCTLTRFEWAYSNGFCARSKVGLCQGRVQSWTIIVWTFLNNFLFGGTVFTHYRHCSATIRSVVQTPE